MYIDRADGSSIVRPKMSYIPRPIGLCLSHHARLHGVVLFKAASGLPLDICFLYITGGLGRVRTNEHPLIGDSHQIIWGHGQV